MKYVMSDIHGCYDKFLEMLNKINFSEDDELYVLGDIFDRGDKSLEILDYIVTHKNIHLLKGNHEQMFEEYFEEGSAYLWYCNGGQQTHQQMITRGYMTEEAIYRYIKSLPYIKVVDNFILVHAGMYFPIGYKNMTLEEILSKQEEDFCLWDRSNVVENKSIKGYKIICGHTPVQTITNNCDEVKILHKGDLIYIDCGCVFKNANGKLGCLCLDDMSEYYV